MVLNGQFPDTLLVNLGWPEADHLRLVPDAAASLNRLAIAFEAHFGKPLYLSDAYRTLAEQKRLKITKGTFAASPGTSNHGWGLAIDMASRINVDNSDEHRWMEANGPHYGWINPWWAENYIPRDGQHEPWHWEFYFDRDQSNDVIDVPAPTPTTQEIDDMTPNQDQMLREVHAMLGAGDATKLRVEDTIGYRVREIHRMLGATGAATLSVADTIGGRIARLVQRLAP